MGRQRRSSRGSGYHRKGHSQKVTGVIKISASGIGRVETSDEPIKVKSRDVGPAMNGDTVSVRMVNDGRNHYHGVVERVIQRKTGVFIGRFEEVGPLRALVPLDKRMKHDFFMEPSDKSDVEAGVTFGDVVRGVIKAYPSHRSSGIATIEKRIGGADDRDIVIDSVIASYDIPEEFPIKALEQASACTLDIPAALEEPGRRDLRERFIATIDPADARDFDDALSLKVEDNGWTLGVHIADVSAYVPWESSLDLAARNRSTSVYLADRVIPMLPEALSNGLCSLNPHEDRLAMTVDLRIGSDGHILDADIFPSVIQSKLRMNYGQVDSILKGEEPVQDLGNGEDISTFLHELDAISKLRYAIRMNRGAIEFETVEARVALDEDKNPIGMLIRKKSDATQLVEEAMLAANETVARFLNNRKAPCAYRVHEQPSPASLESTIPLMVEFGYSQDPAFQGMLLGEAHAIMELVEMSKGRPEEYLINNTLLRSMKRAEYTPKNGGHYGLGAQAYCHFTSPIRRYPDLLVHRALKVTLLGDESAQAIAGQNAGEFYESLNREMAPICQLASSRERSAAAASYETQRIKIAEYMERFVGQSMSGVVVDVETFGIRVRLDETTAEGLCHISQLSFGESMRYDYERKTLTGADSGNVYRLGKRVVVEIKSVDVTKGFIDLALPREKRV